MTTREEIEALIVANPIARATAAYGAAISYYEAQYNSGRITASEMDASILRVGAWASGQ